MSVLRLANHSLYRVWPSARRSSGSSERTGCPSSLSTQACSNRNLLALPPFVIRAHSLCIRPVRALSDLALTAAFTRRVMSASRSWDCFLISFLWAVGRVESIYSAHSRLMWEGGEVEGVVCVSQRQGQNIL